MVPLNATVISTTAANAEKAIAGINWAHPTWDLFIFLFFIIAVLIYGLSLGRDRVVAILASAYMALAVVNAAPYLATIQKQMGIDKLFGLQLVTFIVIFLTIFVLVVRSGLLASSDARGSWLQVILFSFLQVGLLISIILSFLPAGSTSFLAAQTRDLFTTDLARFAWIVAPIVAMIFVKGKKRRRPSVDYDI